MSIKSVNPATEEVLQEYQQMTSAQAHELLEETHRQYLTWQELNIDDRAALIIQLASALRDKKQHYAELMSLEMGKPIVQAMAEVEKCAWTAEVYAEKGREWLEAEMVEADGKQHEVVFQPLGVIFLIMPWNFPFWQVFRCAIPTILAGNTVILKHSNSVPGCALAIQEIFETAGFPKGVFHTMLIDHATSEELMSSSLVRGVSFTGSTSAGKTIARSAGENLKKCVLELGGSDPFIILEDANLEKAVEAAIIGRTQNNGQSCIAAKRFIVQDSIAPEFIKKISVAFQQLIVGDPLDQKTQIGPLANFAQYEEVNEQLKQAIEQGAEAHCSFNLPKKGFFVAPQILTSVDEQNVIRKDEVFGPIAPVIPFHSIEEAIQIANDTPFGLGGAVWTKNLELGKQIALQIDAGAVFVNSIVKSDPRMPFGGVKESGFGRELSHFGIKEFINIKGMNIYPA